MYGLLATENGAEDFGGGAQFQHWDFTLAGNINLDGYGILYLLF